MPFLAKYRCPTCVGHGYWYYSLDSGVRVMSFFFFFSDTMDTLVVKKEINRKLQILTDGQIITIDFVIYPKTKKLKPTTQPSH